MSAIDEIMAEADQLEDCAVAYEKGSCYDLPAMRKKLCDMIAAALADAERKGAEAMRNAAASAVNSAVFPGFEIEEDDVIDAIRALPLPTGSQS